VTEDKYSLEWFSKIFAGKQRFHFTYTISELFCLQNSLIVGMQPQVSGKVGSLVGWLVGWLGFGWTTFGIPDDCRILPKG